MKLINARPISEIKAERAAEEAKGVSVQALAVELANTKIKLMQSDNLNKALADEIVKVKLDIMEIKGGSF